MRTDVLIVGGGPAGCAAAISARQAGLSTVLIEARADARPGPGETLHPGIEPILKKLDVWHEVAAAGFHRHRGLWREANGACIFEPYGSDSNGEWLGFQADRRILHDILQRAARKAGTLFRQASMPSNVIADHWRIVGVTCKTSEIRSRWVFDATGRNSWLGRTLGLRVDRPGPPLELRFGWKTHDDQYPDEQPLFRQLARGWEWYAPLGNGPLGKGRVAWARLKQTERTEETRPPWGMDMTWRLHQPCAGPGYFLLGDAAALLDPAASNGVLRALMSGMLAANLVARVLHGVHEDSVAQTSYISWITGLFRHQVEVLRGLYLYR
jgi:flavin-dependent dehydrogenase